LPRQTGLFDRSSADITRAAGSFILLFGTS
jgi:hypothetical protein